MAEEEEREGEEEERLLGSDGALTPRRRSSVGEGGVDGEGDAEDCTQGGGSVKELLKRVPSVCERDVQRRAKAKRRRRWTLVSLYLHATAEIARKLTTQSTAELWE